MFGLIENKESYHDNYHDKKPCGKRNAILYKESDKSHRLIEIVFLNHRINDCFIYGNRTLAEISVSKKSCQPKAVYVEKKGLSEKAIQCSEWLLKSMKRGKIPTYSDPEFPQMFNNKIDRNFFDGILVCLHLESWSFNIYYLDLSWHKVVRGRRCS